MDDGSRPVRWDARDVAVTGGTIAAQCLGDPDDPALLLLGGATWSRDWWDEGLCATLASRSLRVIRFDTRDTGRSVTSPAGAPAYSADTLVDDAIAVLDAFAATACTAVGFSMGGGLAQRLAALHRDRVEALVLMSTSPAGPVGAALPPPEPRVMAAFADDRPGPDWSDRESAIAWLVEQERPFAGPDCFDEQEVRGVISRAWARTSLPAAAATNHPLVAGSAASIDMSALRGIPALVTHGTADPLFPPAHGEALSTLLRGRLLLLEGVGHQAPPPRTWPAIVDAIAELARDPQRGR